MSYIVFTLFMTMKMMLLISEILHCLVRQISSVTCSTISQLIKEMSFVRGEYTCKRFGRLPSCSSNTKSGREASSGVDTTTWATTTSLGAWSWGGSIILSQYGCCHVKRSFYSSWRRAHSCSGATYVQLGTAAYTCRSQWYVLHALFKECTRLQLLLVAKRETHYCLVCAIMDFRTHVNSH